MVPDVAVSSFPSDVSVSSFGGAEELGGEKTNGLLITAIQRANLFEGP